MSVDDTTISRNLVVLLFFFVLGYSALVGIHWTFNNISGRFDYQIKNEYARYKIGEYILKRISDLESKFYQLNTVFKENSALSVKEAILEEITIINEAIDILEQGGILKNRIELNLVELSEIIEEIEYKQTNERQTYEAIDLRPKLAELQKKLDEMLNIIKLKQQIIENEELSLEDKKKFRLKIEIFFKQLSSHFIRMRENTSRLLHESKESIASIEKNISKQKSFYSKLEIMVTLLVVIIVISLGCVLSHQIQKANEQLKIAKDSAKKLALEAEQASIAKSQFLANMSHDIRTPLNAIIGFSDLLCQAQLPPKEQEHANIISRSAKSLLEIINDILDISKVESGKFEIIDEPFNIRTSLEQMVELFSVKAKEKNIRFIYNADVQLPLFLIGDSVRLQQVFSNLLSNAIKFTPEHGHVCFEVVIISVSEEKISLKFSVADSGIGISKEQQRNLFQPFSQADKNISKKYGGTGLGLSISLKIIEMMGSKIELDSEEGKGSCFYFTLEMPIAQHEITEISKRTDLNFLVLPLKHDHEKIRINTINYLAEIGNIVDIQQPVEKIDILFFFGEDVANLKDFKQRFNCPVIFVGNVNFIYKNPELKALINYYLDIPIYSSKLFSVVAEACHIVQSTTGQDYLTEQFQGKALVAEDNINNQKLIEILLNKVGLECDIANNGEEAVKLYQQNTYQLVFMDVNMPIMDGITAVKQIKTLNKPFVPIIALTANTIKGDKEKYLAAGMNDYLSKPIVFKDLVKVIHRYLHAHSYVEQPPANIEIKYEKYTKQLTMQQLELDQETVDMLLEDFFSTLGEGLANLKAAIASKDNVKIAQAAHYLKGSCANLAMKEAEHLLLEMEMAAKENKNAHFDVERLEKVFEEIKRAL